MSSLEELSLNLKDNEIGDDNVNTIGEVLNDLTKLVNLELNLENNLM